MVSLLFNNEVGAKRIVDGDADVDDDSTFVDAVVEVFSLAKFSRLQRIRRF